MPMLSVFTAAAEQAINQILSFDKDSLNRLKPLYGCRLTVFLDGFESGITMHFSERIDISTQHSSYEQMSVALSSQECCVKTSVDVLPQLTQTSRLTSLIQQGKLSVNGELTIAQRASDLFRQLDIDWEDQLARLTGDVIANQTFTVFNGIKMQVTSLISRTRAGVGNAIVEEKALAAHRLAVVHFADQVSQLRDDVERAEMRLKQLEARAGQSKLCE